MPPSRPPVTSSLSARPGSSDSERQAGVSPQPDRQRPPRVVSEHHQVAVGDEDAVAEIAGPGLGVAMRTVAMSVLPEMTDPHTL